MWDLDAWLAVMEHQGESVNGLKYELCLQSRIDQPVSNMIFPGGIALTAAKLASVFMEQPLTLQVSSVANVGSVITTVPDMKSHLHL